MITLSNGFRFEFVTASGALAYDGKGWPWEWPLRWAGLIDPSLFLNAMKTVTIQPRKGNLRWWKPWDCVRLMPGGAVNSVGLTNPGIDCWKKKIGLKIDRTKIPLAGSIYGEQIAELKIMANIMNDADLVALELNASCPNTQGELLSNANLVVRSVETVESVSCHPVILKLSVAHDIGKIVPATENLVEAYSINSVPWNIVFPNRQSPLTKYGGGGVSGKIAQEFTWPFAEELQSMTDVPIIAPSVWEYQDIKFLHDREFRAISFGSVFLRYPWRPTLYVRRYQKQTEKGETR